MTLLKDLLKTNELESSSVVISSDPVEITELVEAKKPAVEQLNIPHISPEDPHYEDICADLKKMKKSSPALYHKIMNWD